MIGLKKNKAHIKPKHCSDCDELLKDGNWLKYAGRINKRCRSCNSKHMKKYNNKRYKSIKESKIW